MDDARLDALETRLRRVEEELARLRGEPAGASDSAGPPGPAEAAPEPSPAGRAARAARAAAPGRSPRPRRLRVGRDLEAWLGENALLVVGVLALVAAAGFLLKYAFERGWISPGLRVGAGLAAGALLAAWGERLRARGLRPYGAALVGTGAAVAYLALWAAAGPYRLVSPTVGIVALAAVSALVVWSAARARVQLLAALAGVGAFMAPPLLGRPEASPEALLAYCALVAAGVGGVAARRKWGWAFAVAAGGYLLLPADVALPAVDVAASAPYVVAGAALGLAACRRRGWGWLRAAVFLVAWALLAGRAADAEGARAWLVLLLSPALVAPPFLRFLRRASGPDSPRPGRSATPAAPPDPSAAPPAESRTGPAGPVGGPGPAGIGSPDVGSFEWVYFVAAAGAWAIVAALAGPPPLDGAWLALFALLAAPYVVVALRWRLPSFHAVGFGLLALGVGAQFDGSAATAALAGLGLLSGVATRPARMATARWTGAVLVALAAAQRLAPALAERPAGEAAFVGPDALVLYLVVAAFALLAGPLWGEPAPEEWRDQVSGLRPALWLGGGLALLVGGTGEIDHYFGRRGDESELVRSLSVSAFWLMYAGALIAWGFWRDRRPVRLAGLVVTALAVGKVVFQDLTRLEALYRVASFVLLALVTLVAAYAYHRRSRERAGEPGGDAAGEGAVAPGGAGDGGAGLGGGGEPGPREPPGPGEVSRGR